MDMITKQPVTVFRVPEGAPEGTGKQAFAPTIGRVFDYEQSEVDELNSMTPGALVKPVVADVAPGVAVAATPKAEFPNGPKSPKA